MENLSYSQYYIKNTKFFNDNIDALKTLSGDYKVSINKVTGLFYQSTESFSEDSTSYSLISNDWKEVTIQMSNAGPIIREEELQGFSSQAASVIKKTLEEMKATDKLHKEKKEENWNPKAIYLQAITIFGNKSELEVLQTAISKDQAAELIFLFARKTLEAPEPLEEDSIKAIYRLLFESPLADISMKNISNIDHPANIFFNLFDTIEAITINPEKAKEKTMLGSDFDGVNGSYYLKGKSDLGKNLWVFKPENEEKNFKTQELYKKGIKPGQAAKREHVAYLLNYHQMYHIPFTAYVKIKGQVASIQAYQDNCKKLAYIYDWPLELIPPYDFQAIVIYDLRFGNTDRHDGNILCKFEYGEEGFQTKANIKQFENIFAIDHGFSMSNSFEDDILIEMTALRQLEENVEDSLKNHILNIDINKDSELMKKHQIGNEATEWMEFATQCLQLAIKFSEENKQSFGVEVSLANIALLLIRERKNYLQQKDTKFDTFMQGLADILECKKILKAENDPDKAYTFLESLVSKRGNDWLRVLDLYVVARYYRYLTTKNNFLYQ